MFRDFSYLDTLPVEVGVYYGIKNKLRLFKDNNFLWIGKFKIVFNLKTKCTYKIFRYNYLNEITAVDVALNSTI